MPRLSEQNERGFLMTIVCPDMEGVLVPEPWIALAKRQVYPNVEARNAAGARDFLYFLGVDNRERLWYSY